MFDLEQALKQPHIPLTELASKLAHDRLVRISGTPPGVLAYALVKIRSLHPRMVVVWTDSFESAERFAENIRFFRGEPSEQVLTYPSLDISPFVNLAVERGLMMDRMAALYGLTAQAPHFCIAAMDSAVRKLPPRAVFRTFTHTLACGSPFDEASWVTHLEACGYLPISEVEDPGTYRTHAGIIDVFVPSTRHPVRIEHACGTVRSLKIFDTESQTTLSKVDSVTVYPIREHVYTHDNLHTIQTAIRDFCDHHNHPSARTRSLLETIFSRRVTSLHSVMLPHFYGSLESIFDYLAPHNPIHVIYDPESIEKTLDKTLNTWVADYESSKEAPLCPMDAYALSDDLINEYLNDSTVLVAHRVAIAGQEEDALPMTALHAFTSDFSQPPERINGSDHGSLVRQLSSRRKEKAASLDYQLEPLTSALRAWSEAGLKIFLIAASASQAERIRHLLGVLSKTVTVLQGTLRNGCILPSEGFVYLTEEEIFGAQSIRQFQRGKKNQAQAGLEDLRELKSGDYVVHAEHGIGRYIGLERKVLQRSKLEMLQGTKALAVETLVIEYAGGDRLYLPITRLNQIHKFHGADTTKTKLDRLGGQTFARTKARVKENVRKIADELMHMYAERAARSRPGLQPPGLDYEAFEAMFAFEETPDQAAVIEEVLSDLERDHPMDRLVCGDVGFGKTEVAMRAAFRVASQGKQVAVLCPTTVLAEQHFRTFSARFSDHPINVQVLSRFVDKKAQADVLRQLKIGSCDILIGTHRLLSSDVHFKDLGLLVVDEEQRFGVTHKERIKQLKCTVDVLTLSATPIPRTLHMALGGVRDLSLISTPPIDRRAVKTYITRWDVHIIKRAIDEELNRGGQVFFVHNRIEGLYERAQRLQEMVPHARIVVAHGQMNETTLDRTMTDFVEGNYDILCATTIIESGLDIPRANTILIDGAESFGLAQLYQLRGRVGRSKERAACYLITPAPDQLSDEARARLEALERFTALGSGFHIASLDMELRGTGDLLGAEQSGSMALVGLEMFIDMLEQSVAELKGEPPPARIDPDVRVDIEHSLPEAYIDDIGIRLSLYKRMATAQTPDAVEEIGLELLDRFGPLPVEAKNLIRVMSLKATLRNRGILGCDGMGRRVTLHLNQESKVNVDAIMKAVAQPKSAWKLTPDMKLTYYGTPEEGGDTLDRIQRVLAVTSQAV